MWDNGKELNYAYIDQLCMESTIYLHNNHFFWMPPGLDFCMFGETTVTTEIQEKPYAICFS